MSPEKEEQLRQSFRGRIKRAEDASRGSSQNNKSQEWFKNMIQKSIRAKRTAKPTVGMLYTFNYFAKGRDTLPYWDKYPLSICISVGPTLWRSINLHYLPPKMRAEFLEELLVEYANSPTRRSGKVSGRTRLNINWNRLKTFNPKIASHAITSYLYTHIKTPILEVPPEEWFQAVFLPTQQFMHKGKRFSARKVWQGARG